MSFLLVNKSTGSKPKNPRISFSPPWLDGAKKESQIPAITTQERKCGR